MKCTSEKVEKRHEITHKRMHVNIRNSGISFLSELEEKKKLHKTLRIRRCWKVPAAALEPSVSSASSKNCNLCNQVSQQKNDG